FRCRIPRQNRFTSVSSVTETCTRFVRPVTPKVSICVPNLNTLAFLPERFETIFAQTFQDWELLIYDSYSTDGAWEYITELAARDRRIRAWQGPREGTPGSWTPCVREASGE